MERLLIVDDDEFIRVMTQMLLEQDGYLIDCAEDGEIAWQKIDADPSRYDLILLDKSMPNLDGIGLLQRIKADSRFEDLPVIMLTGASEQQDIIEGLEAGVRYYLIKPSPGEILKSVVKNALNELRNKRELLSLTGRQSKALRILRRAEFSLRTLPEAKHLALWLADASMMPERTVNAYSELLINAIEHGNLGITYAEKGQLLKTGRWLTEVESRLQQSPYSERWVEVITERIGSNFVVTIKDQGEGFDWSLYLDFSPERAFDFHGRGIAMAKSLGFDTLQYPGNGNTVIATVKIPDADAR